MTVAHLATDVLGSTTDLPPNHAIASDRNPVTPHRWWLVTLDRWAARCLTIIRPVIRTVKTLTEARAAALAALLHQQKGGHGWRRPLCCSDGESEFGEDCWESMGRVEVEVESSS